MHLWSSIRVARRAAVPGAVLSGEPGFELGDTPVGEAVVFAGCLQLLLQGPVLLGEIADLLFEDGVLGGDPLGGFFGVGGFKITDLAEEQADAVALGADLTVGGFEAVFGVEGPFSSGGLDLGVVAGLGLAALVV